MEADCFECGRAATMKHHVVPVVFGGTRTVPLCDACHSKAEGLDVEHFRRHRAKTRAGLARKKARGESTGNCPYGRQRGPDGKTLVPHEDELAILRTMRDLRRDGRTLQGIADDLNAQGLRTRKNSPWSNQMISLLLLRHPEIAA